jgi:cobalt-zinc-cadmium resistance protein CzcA
LPPPRLTPEGFGELLVGTPNGQLIPLAQAADIKEVEGPAVINRESLQRRVLVEVNVRGRDLVSFVGDARRRVESQVKLPPGVHLEWGGQFENFERASRRLGLVVPMALAIIFGMLFLMFGNVRYTIAVFAGVPFAAIGGVAALVVRGLPFSIPAAVGFIAVGGVAVLNGVVMASELDRRRKGGEPFVEALRNGAVTVLRPVITTALVAAIGFLPMAISTRAGAEVQRPLATVVIGGIISATVLSLIVLPALFRLLVGRSQQAQSAPRESIA